MYRNFGINYKYPRSTGGKFFQQRIDEGRTGLIQFYGVFPTASIAPDLLWRWNETNTTQFGTGFWVSGSGASLVGGTGSVATSVLTSSNAITFPGVKFELSRLVFSATTATPTYLIPINDMPDLPKRYTLRFSYDSKAAGGTPWAFGFCMGTTASSNMSDFYGNVIYFASGSNQGFGLKTIQSGTASVFANSSMFASMIPDGNGGTASPYVLQLNIDMSSTVPGASGTYWRIEMNHVREHDDTSDNFGSILDANIISGNYGSWVGAPEVNKFYLAFHSTDPGAASKWIGLTNLGIIKHPYDRTGGSVEI